MEGGFRHFLSVAKSRTGKIHHFSDLIIMWASKYDIMRGVI